MKKETKAERIERIKLEKDGLDVLKDIYRYAETGEPVDPEDIDRFKWYGLYTQNRSLQEEGDETLYFMLRIKVEGGHLNVEQLKALGAISREFARSSADLTTRQDVQFHWIRIADLPEIFDRLHRVGLSSRGAAGDLPRNIISCPVNGLDQEQIDDVRDIVTSLNDLYRGNRDFSNLPRKFKIGVCGCGSRCMPHEIQDLSFLAFSCEEGETRLAVFAGGGEASNRRFATLLGWIHRDEAVAIAGAVARLYRDRGGRENRSKARLGHLIEEMGAEAFGSALEKESGVTLNRCESLGIPPSPERNHFGLHRHVDGEHCWIGCAVGAGRLAEGKLGSLGDVLAFYGAQGITLTPTQDLIVRGIRPYLAAALAETLEGMGVRCHCGTFESSVYACTGREFCKFALSETKRHALGLIDRLNGRFTDRTKGMSLSVNGCPNSCAHPRTVDLGLVGVTLMREGKPVEGFELYAGGTLAGDMSRFGKKTGIRVSADEADELIETLIAEYEAGPHTRFNDFILEKYCNESDIPSLAGRGRQIRTDRSQHDRHP